MQNDEQRKTLLMSIIKPQCNKLSPLFNKLTYRGGNTLTARRKSTKIAKSRNGQQLSAVKSFAEEHQLGGPRLAMVL